MNNHRLIFSETTIDWLRLHAPIYPFWLKIWMDGMWFTLVWCLMFEFTIWDMDILKLKWEVRKVESIFAFIFRVFQLFNLLNASVNVSCYVVVVYVHGVFFFLITHPVQFSSVQFSKYLLRPLIKPLKNKLLFGKITYLNFFHKKIPLWLWNDLLLILQLGLTLAPGIYERPTSVLPCLCSALRSFYSECHVY